MDAKTAFTIGVDIASRLRGWDHDTWEQLFRESGYQNGWARALIARIVVLIGDSKVVYASGYFEPESPPSGRVAVFTDSSIIRCQFKTQSGNGLTLTDDTRVVASPLSDIRSVTTTKVSNFDTDENPEWPSKVVAELALKDGSTLTLPNDGYLASANYAGLGEFIPTLVARLI